jgi:pimeloyl-ACP methyl ester carboxylesterase
MTRAELRAGPLAGWVAGEGPPVLLLHGGPGLSYDYLDWLADEIGPGHRLAAFQQRGLAPSTEDGPFDVPTCVADVVAVLDALTWDRAFVVGHSWGGHLLAHVAVAAPERLLGALSVDMLGAVGDGGEAAFEAELMERTPETDRRRAAELDERALRGEGTPEDIAESARLLWPAYFASPAEAPPFMDLRFSVPAYAGVYASARASMPALAAALGEVRVPYGLVAGERSPMPVSASVDTAALISGAWVDVVDGAGHFVWHERPGCVRSALLRLERTSTAAG